MPLLLVILIACISPVVSARASSVDFAREVKPLFEKHCLKCHGPDKQKSGYRLDVKEIAISGGESHAPNIVPGSSEKSPLLRFISGEEPDMRMPPKGDLLSLEERRVLTRAPVRARLERETRDEAAVITASAMLLWIRPVCL